MTEPGYSFHEKKLTNEEKTNLLNDYRKGMKISEIAAKYRVDKSLPAHMARRQGLPRRNSHAL